MAYTQKRGKTWSVYVLQPDGTYRCYSKHPETKQRWTTKRAALDWGREEEARITSGDWVDPRLGEITWTEYWETWHSSIDVEDGTLDTYSNLWRTHIQPRYGEQRLAATQMLDVEEWLKDLRAGAVETGPPHRRRTYAYAPRTTDAIRRLMKLMLGDAKTAKILKTNVLDAQRTGNRGRRTARVNPQTRPKLHAEPEQVLALAVNMHQVVGPGSAAGLGAFMRILTGAWMGLRPGEQAALVRTNCFPSQSAPRIVVDDEEGGYQELPGRPAELKAPKSGIGRVTAAPAGFAALLAAWLEFHTGRIVFPSPAGEHWPRRLWNYRWDQASTGGVLQLRRSSDHAPAGEYVLERAVPGLEYKGLRRVHNVWLTELGVPDVARTYRLGHAMDDDMQAAYSVVSTTLERQLLTGLQELWVRAFAGYAGTAALGVIEQFAPDFAGASRRELRVTTRPELPI